MTCATVTLYWEQHHTLTACSQGQTLKMRQIRIRFVHHGQDTSKVPKLKPVFTASVLNLLYLSSLLTTACCDFPKSLRAKRQRHAQWLHMDASWNMNACVLFCVCFCIFSRVRNESKQRSIASLSLDSCTDESFPWKPAALSASIHLSVSLPSRGPGLMH